jgi:hypothetical protein
MTWAFQPEKASDADLIFHADCAMLGITCCNSVSNETMDG